MRRTARTSVQPPARRLLQTAVAAAALAAVLSGCTVGTVGSAGPAVRPVVGPVDVPVSAPAPSTSPRPGSRTGTGPATGSGTTTPTDVYAEWIAAGWSPAPLMPVTDAATGYSASLFGPARQEPPEGPTDGSVSYQAIAAPASVVSFFIISPLAPGQATTAEQAVTSAAASTGRTVTDMQRTTVGGHSAVDVRFDSTTDDGQQSVDLLRVVATPTHLVIVESIGYARDDRVVQQVQAIVADTIQLP